MTTTRWIVAGVAVAGIAAAAWFYFGGGSDQMAFATTPAKRGPIAAVVVATGVVNPVITVTVGSQVSGQVSSLKADFNSVVHKGQVIATLDPSNLQAQVSRDRANVASAMAGLEKARVEAQNAQRAYERAKSLQKQDLLAQSDFDAAEAQAGSTAASVKTAEASVQEARSSLQLSEVNLEHATITSPVDGIVISRDVDVGQTVAASLSAPTLFTIAQDLKRMQVHMNVAESDIGRLAVGQDASFTVDAYPQDRFRGRIAEIRNSPTTIQNVVTYEAVIGVDNNELKLKPGMTANVSVTVATKEEALLIPNAALRYKPPESIQRTEGGGAAGGGAAGGGAAGAGAGGGNAAGSGATGGNSAGGGASGGNANGGGVPGAGSATERGAGAGGSSSESPAGAAPGSEGRRRFRKQGGGAGPGGAQTSEGGGRAGAEAGSAAPGAGGGSAAAAGSAGTTTPGGGTGTPGSGFGGPGMGGGRGGRGGRGSATIWILVAGKPKRVPVTIGITDGSWTEVTSGDLNEGDPVITETTGAAAAAAARTNRPGFGRMF